MAASPQASATASDYFRPLDASHIADLIGSLPDAERQEVLQLLDRAEQAEVRSVLSFPEDTVGSAMELEELLDGERAAAHGLSISCSAE
mgnify:CR=1 FL=1